MSSESETLRSHRNSVSGCGVGLDENCDHCGGKRQEDRKDEHRGCAYPFCLLVLLFLGSPLPHIGPFLLTTHNTAQSWRTHGDRFVVFNTYYAMLSISLHHSLLARASFHTAYHSSHNECPPVRKVIQAVWCWPLISPFSLPIQPSPPSLTMDP